jgi:hypothetical protein
VDNVATKICSQCGATKTLETEFGVNTSSPDGYRSRCKTCFNNARSKKKSPEMKALARLEQIVNDAHAALADPATPFSIRHKADQTIRNADKRRQKLLKPIEEQRKAEEAAKRLTETNPSLERIRVQFYCNPFAQSHVHLAQMVVEMKAALPALVSPADEMARDYLTKLIGMVEEFIADQADAAKEKAEYDQDTIDGRACQDAADAISDKFAALFGEGVSMARREQLKVQFRIYRAEAQAQHKNTKPDDRTANGASCKKIASRILDELTMIAGRLGKAGTEVGPGQTLENFQDLEWSQQRSADQMRAYVRQLTARLEEARATMTPEEYKKKYLELPVAPKEEIVIWKVRLLNGREEWIWPSGNVVRRGVDVGHAEVVKDARLGWTMAPSPAGAELDDENKPVGKMELIQEDDGSWKWIPEGSRTYTQQNDGTWKRDSGGESPWSTPEKIIFKVGPSQPDAEHSEFRSGHWFTEAETLKAEHGPDLKLPPVILPPLTRTKADSIAMPPPMTAAEIARESREPNRWKRHMAREKFQKEQEAALLKGTFIWQQ